ncbi:unnamed protein product [Phaeothamnion confervicola]
MAATRKPIGSVQVEIFAAGDGKNYPRRGQYVEIHYTAFLENGTQFDSSRERGKPFRFRLGCEQVVPGLDDGVAQISVGERAKVVIPASMAYGEKGFPGLVPPNSILVFDIELIAIN